MLYRAATIHPVFIHSPPLPYSGMSEEKKQNNSNPMLPEACSCRLLICSVEVFAAVSHVSNASFMIAMIRLPLFLLSAYPRATRKTQVCSTDAGLTWMVPLPGPGKTS